MAKFVLIPLSLVVEKLIVGLLGLVGKLAANVAAQVG